MKLKFPSKKLIFAAVVLIAAAAGAFFYLTKQKVSVSSDSKVKTGTVTRQTIQSSLSSSGTISPKNSYKITSMVDGTIISADFQEGDVVEEGQVLYQIDSSSINSAYSFSLANRMYIPSTSPMYPFPTRYPFIIASLLSRLSPVLWLSV